MAPPSICAFTVSGFTTMPQSTAQRSRCTRTSPESDAATSATCATYASQPLYMRETPRPCPDGSGRPQPAAWAAVSRTALALGDLPGNVPQDFAFFEGFDFPERLRATAWRTSALKADSSTSSPSWMSIARRAFPSRLELKRRVESFRDAPFKKVSFTTFL